MGWTYIQLLVSVFLVQATIAKSILPKKSEVVLRPQHQSLNRLEGAAWNPTELPDYANGTPLPLVIWHGLGDNYENPGLLSVADLAAKTNPGTFVYIIELGDSASSDRSATFFGNLTTQVASVCEQLANHPVLSFAPAINALGFSQGGQFLRAYIERCNNPPVANLVTFGAQHNGIAEFQACGDNDWLCWAARGLLRGNTWSGYIQGHLVPAQYFRDPEEIEDYLENSNFLADVNNERDSKTDTYKENLKKLEKFVMYVFEDDETVVPKVSGWFSEYNLTSEVETKLKDRTMYKEDWLGLKYLDEKGRLEFKTTPGRHMQLDDEVLRKTFEEFFAPAKKNLAEDVGDSLEL